MSTMRSKLVSGSLLLLFLAVPCAAQQKKEKEDEGPVEMRLGKGGAIAFDGAVGDDEWKDALSFQLERGDVKFGTGRIKRVGRDFVAGFVIDDSPFAMGFRLRFRDPVSQRTVLVLVAPLNPPGSPLAAFLERPGVPSESLAASVCDMRVKLSEKAFQLEVKMPLDFLEIGRTDKGYEFACELRDLQVDRKVLAAYPIAKEGPTAGAGMARLIPIKDWGADEPLAKGELQKQPALELLEDIAREEAWRRGKRQGKPPANVLSGFLGNEDGKRQDAPLAALETKLRKLIAEYPEYISLRANLVRVLTGRNDFEGAIKMLAEIRATFPMMQHNMYQVMVKVELLRNLGRFDEAIEHIDKNMETLDRLQEAQLEKAALRSIGRDWQAELEYRKEDAARDDLPRVLMKTSAGEIVLELFEDDAPNAVANFIELVESGFYVGTRFHWVEGGGRALGGDGNSKDEDPHNDGFGDPGWMIESNPGRRLNWPFTIAYADKRRSRRSHGSTFVLHLTPLPSVNGSATVFGRVIKGRDTARKLSHYDKIESTKVIRKRDHAYKTVKRP